MLIEYNVFAEIINHLLPITFPRSSLIFIKIRKS